MKRKSKMMPFSDTIERSNRGNTSNKWKLNVFRRRRKERSRSSETNKKRHLTDKRKLMPLEPRELLSNLRGMLEQEKNSNKRKSSVF